MSDMLAQQPMIQTSMQLGIDAAQAMLLGEGLEYLAPEDGQCFFEAVNTDQEEVFFNDNMTEENGVVLQDMMPEKEPDETPIRFADLKNNDQKIITIHAPLKLETRLKLKPHPSQDMPEAAILEVPIIQHNELFIQEHRSLLSEQTAQENPQPDKRDSNNSQNFIPQDIKEALELLSQEKAPEKTLENTPLLKPFKPSEFVMPMPQAPKPNTASKPALKIEGFEKVKPVVMSMNTNTNTNMSTTDIEPSEEPQIKEQIGDLKSLPTRSDFPSHHDSLSISQEKVADLPTQAVTEEVKVTPTLTPAAPAQKITVEQLQAPQMAEKPTAYVTPTQQVAVKLVQTVSNDETHFKIKIKPHEKVEIEAKLSFDKDGNIKVILKADSIESLSDLKRDVQHLEKALLQTGFEKHQQSFEFELKDESKNQSHTHERDDDKSSHRERKEHQRDAHREHAEEEIHEYSLSQTGLNIKI